MNLTSFFYHLLTVIILIFIGSFCVTLIVVKKVGECNLI